MKKIGALWLKEKSDQKFFSGTIDMGPLFPALQVVIFKNDYKEKDNQPDYNIMLNEEKSKQQEPVDSIPDEIADNMPF